MAGVPAELFALGPAPSGAPVLVIGDEEFARLLRERGVDVVVAAAPTADALAAVDVVVHGTTPGAPPPADVMAVLAAGRVLVTCAAPRFGLRPYVDHLADVTPWGACGLVELVISAPEAFAPMRRFARLTARQNS